MWSHRLWRAALCLAAEFALVTSVGHADPIAQVLHAQVDGPHEIDASGRGAVMLKVHVTDPDGMPFPNATAIRALIVRGDARTSSGLSSDLITDETSNVVLQLYPGTQSGPLVIRFSAGDTSAELTLALTTSVRKPLVVDCNGRHRAGSGLDRSARRRAGRYERSPRRDHALRNGRNFEKYARYVCL